MRYRVASLLALAGLMIGVTLLSAQAPSAVVSNPPAASPVVGEGATHKYPVTPQAGNWLVCVQVFKGTNSQALAEEMAEYIMREIRIPAYLVEWNRKERLEEQQRVAAIRKQYDQLLKQLEATGVESANQPLRIKQLRIPEEFAVLVGYPRRNFKEMEEAREFLNEVRKLKTPPKQFCTTAAAVRPGPTAEVARIEQAYINPFQTAFVVANPSVPRSKQRDDGKADPFLKELNSGEEYNLLRCSKPYTLVVKMYSGQPMLMDAKTSTSALGRIGFGKKFGEALNASAMQAHSLAEFMRKMKPSSYQAYVLHTRYYSLVTVGEYASLDDPELRATQKALAGMQFKDEKKGIVIESLMPEPVVMKIPQF